jgi:acetate kinase
MNKENSHCILSVNSGSSSLKFALYHIGREEKLLFSGIISDINLTTNNFHIRNDAGQTMINQSLNKLDHQDCITKLFDWLESHGYVKQIDVVGHRIVHGGLKYTQPHLITSDLISDLNELVLFAPEHLPQELNVIKTVNKRCPNLKQVACFDTAFHRNMPRIAQLYALPRSFYNEGGIRYGFHGLSYEYIIEELRKESCDLEKSRIIIAHLGNGASMAAVKDGKSIDTTMGFSPTGGLMMSTRSGDLDPGILLYLANKKSLSPSQISQIVNHQAGLLGVSEISSDMKVLLEKEIDNRQAAEAVDLFCYQAKKHLGSLVAVLGKVDMLVFTGGIGENAPSVRQRICKDMSSLGIQLDSISNNSNEPIISTADSPVVVRVMKTNEELMIARHSCKCIQEMKNS